MRHRLRFAALALVAMSAAGHPLSVGPAAAEPLGSYWELTPFGGFTMFDSKLRFPGSNLPLTDDLHVGGRVAWQSRSWFGFEAAGGFSPTTEDTPGGRDFDWLHVSGNLLLSPARGRWGGPYLFAGGGTSQGKPSNASGSTETTLEFGGGVKLWMTDAVGLRFEARDVSFKSYSGSSSSRLHTVALGAGLAFALGATPRDTDGDGVPDKRDKCPGTPAGAKVDAGGCPLDTDGDGVYDGIDQCEGTPRGATVDAKGCPSDADGDGVFDGLDQCAETPKGATVDAKGCPGDQDGDGVLDGLDQCPGTPKGAAVDERGCPKDSDGDGVFDGLDECPDTRPGLKVDAKGCPIEVTERETELLDTGMIRLQNVNFETNQSDILPESHATLDAVGTLLVRWPQLKLEIGGHTDSRGSAARNQQLSEARAQAVLTYLTGRFPQLAAGQFTVKGYGESRPVVRNTSELNWAKNRRVEFVVMNKDVLRKEVERRRMLQQGEAVPRDTTTAPTPAPADTTRR